MIYRQLLIIHVLVDPKFSKHYQKIQSVIYNQTVVWRWLSFVSSLELVKEGLPTRKKATKLLFWIISIYSVSDSTMLNYKGQGNGNPLQDSCLENSMDRGAWWAPVHKIAKSWTQLCDPAQEL